VQADLPQFLHRRASAQSFEFPHKGGPAHARMAGDVVERERVGEAGLQVFADTLEPGIFRAGKQPAQLPDHHVEKREAICCGPAFAKGAEIQKALDACFESDKLGKAVKYSRPELALNAGIPNRLGLAQVSWRAAIVFSDQLVELLEIGEPGFDGYGFDA